MQIYSHVKKVLLSIKETFQVVQEYGNKMVILKWLSHAPTSNTDKNKEQNHINVTTKDSSLHSKDKWEKQQWVYANFCWGREGEKKGIGRRVLKRIKKKAQGGLPSWLSGKESACQCRRPEKAIAPHSSTLAWRIPWMEESGRLQFMGSLRVGHDWATSLSLSCIGEGNGNPLQCSCLENPRDGGAWWAAVYGVAQSQTRLMRLSSSSSSKHFHNLHSYHF